MITSNRAKAFTLIELIVVIGILALLLGLVVPMIIRASRNAERSRALADLNAIAAALEAYKQDHGDYPRILPGDPNRDTGKALYAADNTSPNRAGARLLAWALIGFGNEGSDGADGPGFRTRGAPMKSQVYGPYLRVDQFTVSYNNNPPAAWATDRVIGLDAELLDRSGRPILYFPASLTRPNIRNGPNPPGFVGNSTTPAEAIRSLYNFADNSEIFGTTRLSHFRIMLGDRNYNGYIDDRETPAFEGPYLLWTAGPDGLFGPAVDNPADIRQSHIDETDDVTNFRQ